MKTITSIKKEMDSLQVELSTKDLKKTQISKIKKRHAFLKLCVAYINSNPTNEFLHSEKERLNNKINLIHAGYVPDQRLINAGFVKEEKKEHKDYNKIMSLDKFKEQLRSINYLIG
jgi:hypothetical protein